MSRVALVIVGVVLVVSVSSRAAPVPDDAFLFRGKSLRHWVKSLSDHNPTTSAAAADTLAVIGPEARSAVSALRLLLKDKDAKVRYSAVRALGEIGPAAAGTAEGLREALAHDDKEIRQATVYAVHSWGEAGIPLLIKAMEDGERKVRAAAARALFFGRGKPTKESIAALGRALADEEDEVRRAAAFALLLAGPAAKDTLPALRKAMKDRDHEVRQRAAEALARAGETKDAITALAAMIDDDDGIGFAQAKAAYAMGSLGPKARDALPVLEAALKSRHTDVRIAAAYAMLRIDGRAKAAIPVLVAEVETPTGFLAAGIAGLALGTIGTAGVPPLVALLKSPREQDRQLAAQMLGLVGPDAAPALSALTTVVKDEKPDVRQAAIAALLRIGPDESGLAALTGALRDVSLSVRKEAAFALLSLGHEAQRAVPVFKELLERKGKDRRDDRRDRIQAARALWKVTRRTDTTVMALVNELEADDPLAMEAVAGVLAEKGPGARAAIPALIAALKNEHNYVRRAALLALAAIGNTPPEALPLAVVALEEDDFEERLAGAAALAAMGRSAEMAVPVLTGRLHDKDPTVRRAAALALRRIAPDRSPKVPPLKEDEPIAGGQTVGEWLRILRSPFAAQSKERIAETLQAVGPEPILIKGLMECLKEPDPTVRDGAMMILCRFGSLAEDAVPLLLPLLKHKHRGTRYAAAEALRAIDPEAAARAGVK